MEESIFKTPSRLCVKSVANPCPLYPIAVHPIQAKIWRDVVSCIKCYMAYPMLRVSNEPSGDTVSYIGKPNHGSIWFTPLQILKLSKE
jgi:hypothetical protein